MHSELGATGAVEATVTKSVMTFRREITAMRRFCSALDAMDHRGRRAALLYVVARYFGNRVSDWLREWGSR